MGVVVRKATLSDAGSISMVYRSDNPYIGALLRDCLDTPENLYCFGGVWMHRDSCAEHLSLFREYGGEIFVAELDSMVVGHIEVITDFNRNVGEYAYISVLMVHRDYRRRGIGRMLVKTAIDYAREKRQNIVLVAAEEQSVGFYRKLGFTVECEWLAVYVPSRQLRIVPIVIKRDEALSEIIRNRCDPLLGRFHGTRMILFEFVAQYTTLRRLDIHHFFFRIPTNGASTIVGIRKSRDIPNVAWAWCGSETDRARILRWIAGIIQHLGIPRILTAIPKQNTNLEVVEKITWMKKRI